MSGSVKISAERTREALEHLGITEEQLKIAKALDREKLLAVKMVLTLSKPRLKKDGLDNCAEIIDLFNDWLPKFDEVKE